MPFFPEGLLTFRPKDLEGIQLEPIIRLTDFGQLAAAGLQDDVFLPGDRGFILQHLLLDATPGAAQNVTNLRIELLQRFADVGVTQIRAVLAIDTTDYPVAVSPGLSWQGSVLIPPSGQTGGAFDIAWGFRAISTFNAGAAANNHRLTFIGAMIPPGNLPLNI